MKKSNFFFFLFICLPATCFLQILPNSNFAETETITCPYDPSVTILQPTNWRLYQTLNNKWNGIVDSNYCINVIDDGQDVSVDLGTIDPNKALFVRGLRNFSPSETLTPDQVYGAFGEIQNPPDVLFKTGIGCPNNICSGLIIGIEIPDTNFTGTDIRYHFDVPNENNWLNDFETCVPTEYFDHNVLVEFIFKLTVEDATIDLKGKLLKLKYGQLTNWYFAEPVSGIIEAPNYNSADSSYFVTLNEIYGDPWGGGSNFLFKYGDQNSYPNSNNIYYIEGEPNPNTTEPSKVNIIAEENNTVVFQPYTALRGALVQGSDSIRHEVNFINNGSDICMEQIIDIIFDDGAKFIYNGGYINFEGKSACMMFQNKGALVVGENQTLYYGQNGKGILALMPGGEIHLQKNSELIIDNTLWIFGLEDKRYPPVFNVYLEKGNKLAFGENAHILNHLSTHPNTVLNVYMNGGELDDSQLSATSRSLINRIYPKPAEHFSDNITIYENPVSTELKFDFVANEDGILTLEIFDMNGRLVSSEKLNVEKGINQKQFPLTHIAAGVYAVQFRSGQQRMVAKILKI